MAAGYSIPESDALGMLGDAHSTNYAENRDFFLNQNNPTNFERTWTTAYFLYKKINAVTEQTPFDQVMDFSVSRSSAPSRSTRARRTSTTSSSRRRAPARSRARRRDPHQDGRHHFFPNSWDLNKKVTAHAGRQGRRGALRSERRLRRRGSRQARPASTARRASSSKGTRRVDEGQVPKSLVQELSLNRANRVKEALVRKFPSLQPNQFSTAGIGWDRPADPRTREPRARTGASRSRSTRRRRRRRPSRCRANRAVAARASRSRRPG
jgi:hypothetical protein